MFPCNFTAIIEGTARSLPRAGLPSCVTLRRPSTPRGYVAKRARRHQEPIAVQWLRPVALQAAVVGSSPFSIGRAHLPTAALGQPIRTRAKGHHRLSTEFRQAIEDFSCAHSAPTGGGAIWHRGWPISLPVFLTCLGGREIRKRPTGPLCEKYFPVAGRSRRTPRIDVHALAGLPERMVCR